jgi:hypothetical protein
MLNFGQAQAKYIEKQMDETEASAKELIISVKK